MASNPKQQSSSSSSSSSSSHTCLCSPTSHPGSFRCSLHRRRSSSSSSMVKKVSSNQLAMAAKAQSIKAFLLQIIKPSSHDLQRRRNFQPKPTRFSVMDRNRNGVAVS